jgi:type VI secretion system secreted protein Hcp
MLAGIFGFRLYKNEPVLESPKDVSAAQVDYFLKIPGVEGESESRGGEIEILSWSWGESEPGVMFGLPAVQSGGGGAGKVSFSDFHFTMKTNKSSPKLMELSASGKMLEEANIYGVKSDGHQFLLIKLKPVFITSYQTGGSSGDIPTDSFSLNFSKIEFEYTPQKGDGSAGDTVRGSWDIAKNETVK